MPLFNFSAPSPTTKWLIFSAGSNDISFQISNASPKQSKPGPKFADVAGTRIFIMRILYNTRVQNNVVIMSAGIIGAGMSLRGRSLPEAMT
jgi:hypothetical protein